MIASPSLKRLRTPALRVISLSALLLVLQIPVQEGSRSVTRHDPAENHHWSRFLDESARVDVKPTNVPFSDDNKETSRRLITVFLNDVILCKLSLHSDLRQANDILYIEIELLLLTMKYRSMCRPHTV